MISMRKLLQEADETTPDETKPEDTVPPTPEAPTTPAAPEGNDPSDQAHKLGLTSAGWGTWKDKTGATVAKTVQGNLVKLNTGEAPAPDTQSQIPPKSGPIKMGPLSSPDKTESYSKLSQAAIQYGKTMDPAAKAKLIPHLVQGIESVAPRIDSEYLEDTAEYGDVQELGRMYKFLSEADMDDMGRIKMAYDRPTGIIPASWGNSGGSPEEHTYDQETKVFDSFDNELWNRIKWDKQGNWSYDDDTDYSDNHDDRY